MGLHGSRLAQRVRELVVATRVTEPFAIEQAAHDHDRLVEPVEPVAKPGPPLRDREWLVFALEPRATNAEHSPPTADVVEGRGQLRREPGVAERVGADHQPEADPFGHGSDGRERRPAFEDRLLDVL